MPIKSLPGITTKHPGIDMVVFRENTEAEYSGFEQEVTSGVVQSLKIVTRYVEVSCREQNKASPFLTCIPVAMRAFVLPKPLSVTLQLLAVSVCTRSTKPISSMFAS